MYKSTKQKSIGFHSDFSKQKVKKKERNISKEATKPFLKARRIARPQNDVTFFKVNFILPKIQKCLHKDLLYCFKYIDRSKHTQTC